jgi:hypothetical protein
MARNRRQKRVRQTGPGKDDLPVARFEPVHDDAMVVPAFPVMRPFAAERPPQHNRIRRDAKLRNPGIEIGNNGIVR